MEEKRDDRYVRSPRDVCKIIEHAKLNADDLTPVTQTIFFSEQDSLQNLKFLELDNYLLEQLKSRQPLIIKGQGKENVVLCTKDVTYDLKEAETSNSMLLMPDLERFGDTLVENATSRIFHKKEMMGIFYSYLEVKPCSPRLEKLYKLLEETKYKGPEREHEIDKSKLCTYEDLVEKIQASETELKAALLKCKTIQINNFIRILDFDFHFRVLSYMVDLIEENSWALDEVSKEETVQSLQEFVPSDIIAQIFELYTEPSQIVDGKQLYKYNEWNVCRYLAEALLQSTGKLVLSDFLQAWKDSVPPGMITNEDMLKGMAVIDRENSPHSVWMFHEESLPGSVTERFRILFQTKERWTKEQIRPYIEQLTTEKVDVNNLLTKYARGATENGVRYYLCKHGK